MMNAEMEKIFDESREDAPMVPEQLEAEWNEAKHQGFYTDSTQRVRDYIDDYYISRIVAVEENAAL